MANTIRMISKRVLPGSFWCEIFTYRWITAEPGSLSKITWAVVTVYSKKLKSGSNVVDALFIMQDGDYVNFPALPPKRAVSKST
jgi:hypothetical protein